ncbi:MAG TPA: GNAT family N-acetyltransferase [Azospirillaceae bacterium]|nr:GNAT family N-acetyltransferase [Azospirillaceae bacterium]
MAEIVLDHARPGELAQWDRFVDRAVNGTLFHQRAFLAYHGDRFAGQERFLVARRGDAVVAQIALAVREDGAGRVALSPYGGSVGSFVFAQPPTYAEGQAVAAAFVAWLGEQGIGRARLTVPPATYSPAPMDSFSFNLLEAGFASVIRDISSTVPLAGPPSLSEAARRKERKARAAGLAVERTDRLDLFWPLMEATFAKHSARPTHDRRELDLLLRLFPERVLVELAVLDGRPVAGNCYFVLNRRVVLSFYPCQDPEQPDMPGLALLLADGIARFREQGFAWLDLGTSTVGMQPRPSLFQFKEGYGRAGVFRETFEWRGAP